MKFLRRPHPFLGLWLPLALLACVPVLTDWLENQYQVTIQDLPIPLVFSLLTALGVAGIFYRWFLRERLSAYAAALLATLLLTNGAGDRLNGAFSFLHAFNPLPSFSDGGIEESVAFAVVVLILCWLLGRALGRFVAGRAWSVDIAGGLTVCVAIMFALQLFGVAKVAASEWPQFFYRPPALQDTAKAGASKPDIYYIVLDRYASQDVLTSQFGFDNSSFTSYLATNDFFVNPSAHNNYPYTTMSISATLNAGYHSDMVEQFAGASSQTVQPYHDAIRDASVIRQLKQLGYSYDLVGNWYETSNQSPLADHTYQQNGNLTVFGHTFALNSFGQNELEQSPFWRLVRQGIRIGNFQLLGYSAQDQEVQTQYQLSTLKTLASQPAGGRFIFAHILVPHDPYYYNADGSLSTTSGNDSVGQPIKQKYTDQIQYINAQMESVLSTIPKQGVVVLQADEGPYPMQLNDNDYDSDDVGDELSGGDMNDWSDQDIQMKYGILAAYHVPQATQQDLAQGGDSINIFRVVLNSYFSAGLSYLPRCYYSYPDGRSQSFVYTDITQRLTGQTNSQCPADSDFKQ